MAKKGKGRGKGIIKYGPDEFSQNVKLNVALRAQEKLGFEDRYASRWREAEIVIPNDVKSVPEPQVNRGEMRTAPTSNPSRPRAYVIAYAPDENRLIVVFRDGTWWQYDEVPATVWLGLKNSPSTGKYLRSSGLDQWPYMGPANIDELPSSIKEQISYSAQIAGSIQAGDAIRNAMNDRIEDSDDDFGTVIRG